MINERLQDENLVLKKELNKLRKLEAGWFGKNKNVVKKEVIIKNKHYLKEKEKITGELLSYREECEDLRRERAGLLRRIKALESQLATFNNKFTNDRNLWLEDRKSLV